MFQQAVHAVRMTRVVLMKQRVRGNRSDAVRATRAVSRFDYSRRRARNVVVIGVITRRRRRRRRKPPQRRQQRRQRRRVFGCRRRPGKTITQQPQESDDEDKQGQTHPRPRGGPNNPRPTDYNFLDRPVETEPLCNHEKTCRR